MKSLITLSIALLNDVGAQCGVDVAADVVTTQRRYANEGEQFLTVDLPRYCTAFERALADGGWGSVTVPNFKCRGGYPRFLRGMLSLIFADDGSLLDEPEIFAIQGIRQFLLLHSKIFEVCTPERVIASMDGYVECERQLHEQWYTPTSLRELRAMATCAFGPQLRGIEESCRRGTLVPQHGPGSTADRLLGNQKFDSPYWPRRLDESFPVADYLLSGYSNYRRLARVEMPEPGAEQPVRVIAVPKTASKARIIAMEPVNVQYVQQALLREFMRAFSGGSRFVDLSDQSRNRRLAREGSVDGKLSTIDLSEASDRVPVDVVEAVFGNYPELLAALTNSRSLTAKLTDGRVVSLRKFASMGSATCFPVESIVFATIALCGIARSLSKRSFSEADLSRLATEVTVFGDDIIVPTHYAQSVIQRLVEFSAIPNARKSFWTGKFRESCGGDYYAGEDVTVCRLRRRLPQSQHDASEVVALISLRNHLYLRGFWGSVQLLDDWIAGMAIPMPIVEQTSPVLGRWSVAFRPQIQRWHPDYQTPLVRGLMVRSVIPWNESSSHGKLLKCTLPGRTEPFASVDHLTRSGRPDSVRTKIGWGSLY